jgi:DNA primase small subunit
LARAWHVVCRVASFFVAFSIQCSTKHFHLPFTASPPHKSTIMAPGILLQEDTVMGEAPSSPPETQTTMEPSSPPAPAVIDAPSSGSEKENRKTKLEDMFDDSDDDDLMSSLPMGSDIPMPIAHTAKFTDPDVMRAFYQRLFPFRYLFQWLSHSPTPTKDFAHREFAFTLSNDAYLRYQSFPSADLYGLYTA